MIIPIPLVARITGVNKRFDIARSEARKALKSDPASREARVGLGLMAVQNGDRKAVAEQYAELVSRRKGYYIISSGRLLGLLTHTMGKTDIATTHFEDAYTFSKKGGYLPELAWTCCAWAEAPHISENTAAKHTSNIFAKTKSGNRTKTFFQNIIRLTAIMARPYTLNWLLPFKKGDDGESQSTPRRNR